jgi:subtilisin
MKGKVMAKSGSAPLREFVVLPTRGLLAAAPTSSPGLKSFLSQFDQVRSFSDARAFAASSLGVLGRGQDKKLPTNFRVLDDIGHENGAKLVQMTDATANDILAVEPGLRIVPVVYYQPMWFQRRVEARVQAAAGAGVKTSFEVRSKKDGSPVKDALVVAFTDYANREGAEGKTNSKGVVRLSLGSAKKLQRLYVYPALGYWGALRRNVSVRSMEIRLDPIDLNYKDGLRHLYGAGGDEDGKDVKVAVVDTGVGPHADLTVAGGANTVLGEKPDDYSDSGAGHGTHVAGIIAAHGTPPKGVRGLAPAVELYSYRVFGAGAKGASNFAILKAINLAVEKGCHVVNLSLGGGVADPAVASAIHDARQKGTLVVAAAGNEDRSPVAFPANDPLCIAISALGRKGTFPKGSSQEGAVAPPPGSNRSDFIAAFSNVGPEVGLTGPGVGIISTFPGGHAVLDGTSMATPAVSGVAARFLSGKPGVLAMAPTQARSDEIARLLLQSAQSLGFPAELQGRGLPR